MSEVKTIEYCRRCGKATKLEVNFFGKRNVIPCRCECEGENENNDKRDTAEQ